MTYRVLQFFIALLVALAVSCGTRTETPPLIELPPTPVLTLGAEWAVVNSTHLRLRTQPSVDADLVATLWRGYVLEVLSKQNTQVEIEGIIDYWLRVQYGGLQGWVFGGYLLYYDSLDAAKLAANDLRQ